MSAPVVMLTTAVLIVVGIKMERPDITPPFTFSEADRIGLTKAIRCNQAVNKKMTVYNSQSMPDDIQEYCR